MPDVYYLNKEVVCEYPVYHYSIINKFSFFDEMKEQDLYIRIYNNDDTAKYLPRLIPILENVYNYNISNKAVSEFFNSICVNVDRLPPYETGINRVNCIDAELDFVEGNYIINIDSNISISFKKGFKSLGKVVLHFRCSDFEIATIIDMNAVYGKNIFLQSINTLIWIANTVKGDNFCNYIRELSGVDKIR